jgi:hypothetical protein
MVNQYNPDYDPAICAAIPEMFSDGSSITKVCVIKLKIARSTYYEWKERHPEFAKACEIGEQISETIHEKKLQDGADGEIENYNAASRIFIMKSRFRKTYGEDKVAEKSASDSVLEQLMAGKLKIVETK